MALTKKMQAALNQQITDELYSSYLYLSMAAYFEKEGLKGFGAWMRKQTVEEAEHGMKIFDYVLSQGGKVSLDAIKAPQREWKSPATVFEHVYRHERDVTSLIHNLRKTAQKEKDKKTFKFLKWYVDEQVEEEATSLDILKKLKAIGKNKEKMEQFDSKIEVSR